MTSAFVATHFASAAGAVAWMLAEQIRNGKPSALGAISGAVAGLALTLTFALERGWLTVGLSLMAPGIAWIADKRPVPLLRKLCGAIAALTLARVGWDPRIVGDAVGTTPIFNWLLWGYGVPAASFWLGSTWLRRRGDDVPLRAVESAAILFTVLLAFLEIRHAVNHGDMFDPLPSLTELALQVCVTLAMVRASPSAILRLTVTTDSTGTVSGELVMPCDLSCASHS